MSQRLPEMSGPNFWLSMLPTASAGLITLMIATSTMAIYQNTSLLAWQQTQSLLPSATFEVFPSAEPVSLKYLPSTLQPELNNYLSIISASGCIICSMHIITTYISSYAALYRIQTTTLLALTATLFLTTATATWTNMLFYFTPALTQAELSSIHQSGLPLTRPFDLETWSCSLASMPMEFETWNFWHGICQQASTARWTGQALCVLLVAVLLVLAMFGEGQCRLSREGSDEEQRFVACASGRYDDRSSKKEGWGL